MPDGFVIGIIYGPEFELLLELQASVEGYGRFNPLRGEGVMDVPFFIRVDNAKRILESPVLRKGWLDAALFEMQRARSSPYRKFHQSVVYEAAVNLDYRATILENAFSVAQKGDAG